MGTRSDAGGETGTSYNSATGPKASTTGTVYGIYDMAGGAHDIVAGCYSSTGKEFGLNIDTKYFDMYVAADKKEVLAMTGWNEDYAVGCLKDYPVVIRGGAYCDGENSGLFTSVGHMEEASSGYTFRPVWVAP